ncbi:NADAR family protein, partial [Acinetobacter baumannii]
PILGATPAAIRSFTGDYHFLSNFCPSPLTIDDIVYPTVEHAFQAMKAVDRPTRAMIAGLLSPADARQEGQCLALRPDWQQVKLP